MMTLEEYTTMAENTEAKWTRQVGSAYRGNSRSLFKFADGQVYLLDSSGCRTIPARSNLSEVAKAFYLLSAEPRDWWSSGCATRGKAAAEAIAAKYGATLDENPYQETPGEWWYYVFDTFEKMVRFAYDRHTGVLVIGKLQDR